MKRICIVVADATRARIFTYEQLLEPDGPHEQLREVADLVDPARQNRPTELFSDDSGSGKNGHHGYAFDDHRESHLDQLDASFAKTIIAEAARVTNEHGGRKLAVIASSRMLGALRTSLEPLRRTLEITELQRDFTKLPTTELRERLAELDILPARARFAVAHR